jgi:hypothetical protein
VQAHFHGEPVSVIPKPSSLAELAAIPEYSGGVWMLVEVDWGKVDAIPSRIDGN